MPLPWVDAGPDPNPGAAPSWIDSLEPIDRVGHWPLDEASGNALDVSGYGQTLTVGSGGLSGRRLAGPAPGVYSTGFYGTTNSWLSGAVGSALYGASQWTLSAWVYLNSTPALRTMVACLGGWRGSVFGPYLLMGGGDGAPTGLKRPVVGLYQSPPGTFYVASDTSELALSTWYMLTGSYDGVSVRYYRDAMHLGEAAGIAPGAGAANMEIGRASVAYPNAWFPGRIADVRFYNWKLSGDDIERLYYRTLAQAGRGYPPVWHPLGKVT